VTDDIIARVAKALDAYRGREETRESKDSNPMVWVGNVPVRVEGEKPMTRRDVVSKSDMIRKAVAAGARRDPQYYALADQLVRNSFMSESASRYPGGVAAGLGNAIDVYQSYAREGGTMNFTQWLDWYSSGAPEAEDSQGRGGRSFGRGGYSGPTTTTSVTLTDEMTAEALLDKFSRDLLGRGLTKRETEKYLKEFRKGEQAAPQVTTSVPGRGTMSQVTETAASKEEMLRQIVSRNPDYEKFQINTTIMDMLMEDIEEGKRVIYG